MTTPRRTARRPVAVAAARRGTAWDDAMLNFSLASGALAAAQQLMQNVSDTEKRGCTLQRLIIGLNVEAATRGIGNGVQRVWLGIGLTSDDAYAGNALPDPESGSDYPVQGWLWRWSGTIWDSVDFAAIQQVRIEKDLRAQRKLDRSTMFLTIKNDPRQGTAFEVQVTGIVRMLYKLP